MRECDMNKNILDSWQRCQKYNLSRDEGYLKTYPDAAINNILRNNKKLIEIATPFMETLYHFVNKSSFMSVLTDKNAVVLNIIVEKEYKTYSDSINFDIGISCAEKDIGTMVSEHRYLVTYQLRFMEKNIIVNAIITRQQ